MANLKNYDEKSIQVLKGLEAVRKRPGMYIGSTDTRGLHHLVWEIFDNAVDEALSGFGNTITLTVRKDNSICVEDEGRGIPYKKHESGISTLQLIFTTLHAGGKFSDSGYKVSGGLHGLGGAVVNALSSKFTVTSARDGKVCQQTYLDGGSKIQKDQIIGESRRTGTKIEFWPDPKIFQTTTFVYETIRERIREAAFLIKGLKVVLIDERSKKREEFEYENGIKEYVQLLAGSKKPLGQIKTFAGEHFSENCGLPIEIDCAFMYFETYSENIISFVNNIRTKDGGTHEIGFKTAFTRAFNEYARKYNFLKEKDENLDGVDLREGLIAVISLKVPEKLLQFEGQTKAKLGTPEARTAVDQVVYEKLSFFLEENKKLSESLLNKALLAKKARIAARKAREQARQGKTSSKKDYVLSGKLTPALSKKAEERELFLVEGDSAGGSAKQGRNRKFQAILPLKGKILNVEKARFEKMLASQEVATLITALGAGIGKEEFNPEKLRYHRIIIMTDADVDGAHIRTLLLTFFYRQMPELVERGYIYIAQPPLYKAKYGKQERYLKDELEKDQWLLGLALEKAKIVSDGRTIEGAELADTAKQFLLAKTVIEQESRFVDELVLRAMLHASPIDLTSSENADKAVAELSGLLDEKEVALERIEGHEGNRFIKITRKLHGNVMVSYIEPKFLNSKAYQTLTQTAAALKGLVGEGAKLYKGENEYDVDSFETALNILLQNAQKGMSIQRYKGLGEMNPEQLWETTMDPAVRRLLKVRIEDAISADEVFVTLMGDEVEPRRAFIENNALIAQNIDA